MPPAGQRLLIILSAVALLWPVSSGPARAYENPALAAAAREWREQLRESQRGGDNPAAAQQAFRNAQRWAGDREWARAVAHYAQAGGLGLDHPVFWLQFSYALAQRDPADRRAGLRAAYNAFRTAGNEDQRAQALFHIGSHYQSLGRGENAIEAYEAGLQRQENRTIEQRLEALYAEYRHHIRRAYAVTETDTPQICLEFSKDLPRADRVRYGDYIRLDPGVQAVFQVRDRTLCIQGVDHGQSYRVTAREGLPSAGELRLTDTRNFTVAVADRSPALGFRGDAYILPRVSRQGIPMTSVNVSRARLRLFRIGSRNLVPQLMEGRLRRLLSGYEAATIANTDGEQVWEGAIDLEAPANEEVTTAIPAERILRDPEPGVYVLVAEPGGEGDEETPRYRDRATQWLIVTDLAVTTYRGRDGLHVFVRSFDSGRAAADVRVRLIARNNEVLGEGESDGDGHVHFAAGLVRGEGGNSPAAVLVEGEDGDFSFYDLLRPAFDLSDRGVGGRMTPGPIDAFLYPERGVYRPGETVHLTALLRSDRAEAIRDMPLTLKVRRPDGVVAREMTLPSAESLEGGYAADVPLSGAAHTGRWSVAAHVDPEGEAVGTATFQVEDFVPERLEMDLSAARDALVPGEANAVRIEGRFLYGAPAAGLRVEGEVVLRQDMNPYPDWEGYQFGLVTETWSPTRRALDPVTTDREGHAELPLTIEALPQTTRPTKADMRVSLIETGGRAIERVISLPVRGQDLVIGIRREGNERRVSESEDARFSVIALDGQGERRAAAGLRYELVRENHQYQWYYENGRWRYRVIRTDRPVTQGDIGIAAGSPAELSFRNEWGAYRLIVRDPSSGAATSVRFYVGWFTRPTADNVPDKLTVTLDKERYAAGETARVNIRPPFDGRVHLVVASDHLIHSRAIEVPRAGRTVEIEVEEDWGPGVYVTATAYRPMSQREGRGPARAIGVAHVGRDFSDRTLDVSIEAPEQIEPRRPVDVSVRIDGARAGRAYVTVAAVDEGILSLTGYRTPDPAAHYYGKRRLAVDIRDAYGRLIDPYAGRLGEIRQGGDAAARERHLGGLDASSVRTVSLFSGLVRVDGSGRATVPLDVPDFNGRLRLMAVAYDRNSVGSAEADMIVRDPVVSIVTLPRFLAPGDAARVNVSLHNVDGAAGNYRLALSAQGAAARFETGARAVVLARDERRDARFVLQGETVGTATIRMTLMGPDGFRVERSWPIAVRPAQATVTRYVSQRIEPGERQQYTAALFENMLPGTGRAYLSFAGYPDWGVAGLIRSLDLYPYGCSEQVTSRAMPLLHLSAVARTIGVATDEAEIRTRVQAAIDRLVMMQRPDGAFGLWGANDEQEIWLSAYVMDFLTQAKTRGYLVPEPAFLRGLARLDEAARTDDLNVWNLHVVAYAHYVLARSRRARLGDLRYFHDNFTQQVPTALGKAQIGAALALYGDVARAEEAFISARTHEERPAMSGRYWQVAFRDYGSELRDAAAVLFFIAQAENRTVDIDGLIAQVSRDRASRRHMSTQEQAWTLLAASVLGGTGDPLRLAVDGEAVDADGGTYTRRLDADAIGDGIAVENRGETRAWAGVTVSGIPAADLPAEDNGFRIRRRFYHLDGTPADLADIAQSEVLVALIEVEQTTRGNHQTLVVDLLPSGFEIENPRLGGRDVEQMSWLPGLADPRTVEPRDDRYVAAVDMNQSDETIRLAYIVRAVTPGRFRLPAAHVEDMYRPSFFGRMAMGDVVIRARGE